MGQSDYQTIFEIGLKSFPWGSLLHPIPFIIIGVLLFLLAKRQVYKVVGVLVAMLATFFFIILAVSLGSNFVSLRRAYLNGESSLVEGVVEDFHPAPPLGAARESFSVRGVTFSYNPLDSTPCFHNSPPHKGPITSGLNIRISYKGNCIQRIDIHPGVANP